MKEKIACAIVALMFILVVMPVASASTDTDINEINDDAQYEYSKVEFTNRSVAILSDSNVGTHVSSALSQSTSKLSVSDSFSVAETKDIAIIDSNWAATNEQSVVKNGIKSLIENNNAVIVIDDNADLIKESGASVGLVGFADDSQAYGIIETMDGRTYCYSVSGFDNEDDAILAAYNWADKTMNEGSSKDYSFIGYPWGFESLSEEYMNCGDYGYMSCSTAYFKLESSAENSDTYLVSYDLYAMPNSGYSKSEMDVYCKVNADSSHGQYQSLISTSPASTSIKTSADVHLDPGIGSISAYVSWSYTKADVNVHNNSSIANNIIDIDHEIDECKIAGSKGYHVVPGALIKVIPHGNGGYHGIDKYSTEFCKVVVPGMWHNTFKTYEMAVEVDTLIG